MAIEENVIVGEGTKIWVDTTIETKHTGMFSF